MLQREVVARLAAAAGGRRLRTARASCSPLRSRSSGCSTWGRAPSSRRRGCGRRWCGLPCGPRRCFAVSRALRRGGGGGLRAAPQDAAQCPTPTSAPCADQRLRARPRGARPRRSRPQAFNALAEALDRARRSRLSFGKPGSAAGGTHMSVYRRILLVVDLTEDSLTIGRRAQALAAATRRGDRAAARRGVRAGRADGRDPHALGADRGGAARARADAPAGAGAPSSGCRRAPAGWRAAMSNPRSCA